VYQVRQWLVKTPGKSEGNFLSQRLNVLTYLQSSPEFIAAQKKRYIVTSKVTKQFIVAPTAHLRHGSIPAFT